MNKKIVSPRGVWMKTHVYLEGTTLHGVTYLVAATEPEVFHVTVDLKPIIAAVVSYHKKLHAAKVSGGGGCIGCDDEAIELSGGRIGCGEEVGDTNIAGFFGSIGKVIKKVGITKLAKQVADVGKTVIKSKITGGILLGATAVFPPVGGPALAAYASANAVLAAAEHADAIRRGLAKAVGLKKAGKKTKATAAVDRVKTDPAAQAKVKKALDRGAASKKFVKGLMANARYNPDPKKQAEAMKGVRVFQAVAQHRQQLKNIASPPKGQTGLVVDQKGHIIRGRFVREAAQKNAPVEFLLATKGKVTPGYYQKVGGCIGCL